MIDNWPTAGDRIGSDGAASATTGLLVALTRLGDTGELPSF